MPDITKPLYTVLAVVILAVMLLGSPLAGFGCRTVNPARVSTACETNLRETAVQTNFVQPATATLPPIVTLGVYCLFILPLRHHQEIYLAPPFPPPRLFT